MKKARKQNSIIIYQAKNGAIELKGDFQHETIWASQAEMAKIFNVTPQNITLHLGRIFKEKELHKISTCKEYLQVQKEGKREIKRKIKAYNLDVIIAVGYRINSLIGTRFRQWATKTLRQHITKGYTINPKIVKNNYAEFRKAVENIKQLLPAGTQIDNKSVLELVSAFADTWLSLDAYDKDKLSLSGATKKSVDLTADQLDEALLDFKKILVKKKEATELFGQARQKDAISGIVGNVMQSFGGKSVYPTVEEKAAHLLYFIVKNHPYVDGNKRSGAYAFVWFLKKAGVLDISRITPPALTAITLFIAESNPKHKDKMIRLVLQMLKK
jgi:prophage maintenance system killer protein